MKHVMKVHWQKILLKINNYKAKETRGQRHWSLAENPHDRTNRLLKYFEVLWSRGFHMHAILNLTE